MNREPQTHASTTVNRDQDGSIRYVVVRAEYFIEVVDKNENDLEKYQDGVNAKFRFDVNHTDDGVVATLDSVKDIADDAATGYETSLKFLKAVPIAEDAVMNVPGIDEAGGTEEYIMAELDRGRSAI